eukprot:13607238-Heterocapsa_arctica.AAC.1
MRITVQTLVGSRCEINPCGHWTCCDLHTEIHKMPDVSIAQQRLIHDCRILEAFMAAAAIYTIGQLLRLDAGQE